MSLEANLIVSHYIVTNISYRITKLCFFFVKNNVLDSQLSYTQRKP